MCMSGSIYACKVCEILQVTMLDNLVLLGVSFTIMVLADTIIK